MGNASIDDSLKASRRRTGRAAPAAMALLIAGIAAMSVAIIAVWAGAGAPGEGPVGGGQGSQAYTVEFNSMGGSPVGSRDVGEGSLLSPPQDPHRDGSTFDGWHADEECNTPWLFSEDRVYGDMTLYAKWV
ncbi:MAG: InlB B-repeat-containing protein [Candidatus Methanoplasma sp.]|jgi:uncharacterized repeat protein (TIGR02543 family)|nr:InlB B-repeat-containing protein [Candidatus Methanoplasma sp.]